MMFRSAIKVLLFVGAWSTLLAPSLSSESTDLNETEPSTDTAEFRQGGQQLSYPYAAAAGGGATYPSMGNVIRNLYRPPSLGLTDKVRHWVKSFMNRRQYVKPYYGAAGLSYDMASGGKPVATGYKAISVPLRQLQKYYKPYYGEGGFQGYNPSSAGGLYASETAGSSHFAGAEASFPNFGSSASFGDFSNGAAGLYGASGSPSSGLYGASGSPGSSLYGASGSQSSGLYGASGSSSGGLYGASGSSSGGLYGGSGSPSSGLFQGSSNSGGFNVDGATYNADPSSNTPYFGGSSGGYGSNPSGFAASAGASYGDLYASGANPALYTEQHHPRGYQQQQQQQQPPRGSSSALYMSSSDDRNGDKSKELTNSFDRPAEASYSVSFQQQQQGKSYSAGSFDSAGFQPVAFGSESANAPAFQEKSSS